MVTDYKPVHLVSYDHPVKSRMVCIHNYLCFESLHEPRVSGNVRQNLNSLEHHYVQECHHDQEDLPVVLLAGVLHYTAQYCKKEMEMERVEELTIFWSGKMFQ